MIIILIINLKKWKLISLCLYSISSRLYHSKLPEGPVEDLKLQVMLFPVTGNKERTFRGRFLLWSFNKSGALYCPTDVQVLATDATVPPPNLLNATTLRVSENIKCAAVISHVSEREACAVLSKATSAGEGEKRQTASLSFVSDTSAESGLITASSITR